MSDDKSDQVVTLAPPPWIADSLPKNRWDEARANYICQQIANGRSLVSILREPGMPVIAVVQFWQRENINGFRQKMAEARKFGLLVWADEIVAISDDGTNDSYIDEKGNHRVDQDVIARSHLRIRARQWMLAKHMPEIYGERVKVDQTTTNKVVRDTPEMMENKKAGWLNKHGGDPGANWAKYGASDKAMRAINGKNGSH